MFRFAIRVLLTAFVFTSIFPMIGGVHFTGTFWPTGIAYAALFAAISWAVGALIGLGVAAIGVGTLGVGLFVVIPALLLGFWLIPAVELEILAHYFPQHFSVETFGAAILAGLVLLVVNIITGVGKSTRTSRNQ